MAYHEGDRVGCITHTKCNPLRPSQKRDSQFPPKLPKQFRNWGLSRTKRQPTRYTQTDGEFRRPTGSTRNSSSCSFLAEGPRQRRTRCEASRRRPSRRLRATRSKPAHLTAPRPFEAPAQVGRPFATLNADRAKLRPLRPQQSPNGNRTVAIDRFPLPDF